MDALTTSEATPPLPPTLAGFASGESPHFSTAEADAVYAVGCHLYGREDFSAATDVFRLLVLGSPHDARSWFALAACHDAVDELERASALYNVATCAPDDTNGSCERARAYLARALLRQDRVEEAITQVAALSEEMPSDVAMLRDEVTRAIEMQGPRCINE